MLTGLTNTFFTMKQYSLIISFLIGLFMISCSKIDPENNDTAIDNNGMTIVSAVVRDGLTTKSDYEISGNLATFSWTSDDEFYRLVRATSDGVVYGNYNHYTYSYQSGSGNNATFSGGSIDSGYEDSGYALYPVFKYRTNTGAGLTYTSGTNDFYLNLGTTIAYDRANPLKNIVPMIGKKTGTSYDFKPITGVIAFTVYNIPSTATSVELSTTNGGLSGKSARFCNSTASDYKDWIEYYLGPSTLGLRQPWLAGQAKTYTFDAGSMVSYNNEATFYFPIATSYTGDGSSSPYTNFTIKVKSASETKTISATGLSVAVGRGEIVFLPSIDCNYVGTSITAAVQGNASAIKASYSLSKGTVTSVRAAAITSKTRDALNSAIPNNTSGTDITGATSSASAITVSSGFSTSGTYYVGIKAFNGETEVGSYIVKTPVYYLSTKAQSNLIKQFSTDGTNGSSGWTIINGEYINANNGSITFAISNDCTKGNIMVNNFCGVEFSTPSYGLYEYSENSIVIYYSDTPNYTDSSGYEHHFAQGTSGSSSSATNDIVLLINDTSVYGASNKWPLANAYYIYDAYQVGNDYAATSRIQKMVAGTKNTTLDIN